MMTQKIRPINASDNKAVANIIHTVMPEFGAVGPGFAIEDPEVCAMYGAYQGPRARYFVVEWQGQIVGGAGVAPLQGAGEEICELRKMYILNSARGFGIGRVLLKSCLKQAKEFGYRQCYLETLDQMTIAKKLYEKFGFQKQCGSLGNTGHFGCNNWYLKELRGTEIFSGNPKSRAAAHAEKSS